MKSSKNYSGLGAVAGAYATAQVIEKNTENENFNEENPYIDSSDVSKDGEQSKTMREMLSVCIMGICEDRWRRRIILYVS